MALVLSKVGWNIEFSAIKWKTKRGRKEEEEERGKEAKSLLLSLSTHSTAVTTLLHNQTPCLHFPFHPSLFSNTVQYTLQFYHLNETVPAKCNKRY